ncbi:heterokaryon incompatibility protein-domain-containing protein [Plectosphaerella plurivora]|uniref:Heterokaryon incompatibility protein-domain-containing protein n=1 Tax=Plectosphaerella plurivora TaxID=936078 RepID=A0A9P8V987_9PEZI|nr:heterokaryon incompatibility protein-domain-containing protein [Plectosphaerella plurivora]
MRLNPPACGRQLESTPGITIPSLRTLAQAHSLLMSSIPKPDAKSTYHYQTLGDREIRLLRLRPATSATDPLHGDLFNTNLDTLPPPHIPNSPAPTEPIGPSTHLCFDAISYAWGAAALTDAFTTPQGSIPITSSLVSILRRVRPLDNDEPLLFWADAICINQADTHEKEHQIALMGVIYASAVRVLCDLGESFPGAEDVLDAMANYRRRNIRRGLILGQGDWPVLEGPDTAAIMGIDYPTAAEANAIPELKESQFSEPFAKFASSPWFRRLWVVQEFVLGRDVVMLLGQSRVHWGELWASIMRYKNASWPWGPSEATTAAGLGPVQELLLTYHFMCLTRASRLADLSTSHGRTFMAITRQLSSVADTARVIDLPLCFIGFGSSAVTVPRDRYFAILGLLGPDLPAELRPDYSSPMEDITMRFWRAAYRSPTGADLLNSAGIPGRSPQYPSWVRDITVSKYLDHMWTIGPISEASHAAGGVNTFSATFFGDDPGRMFVRAHYLDVVTDILDTSEEEPFAAESLLSRMIKVFTFFAPGKQTIDCPSDTRYSHTGEHIHEAAWKTMTNHHKQDTQPGPAEKFEGMFKIGVGLSLVARSHGEGTTMTEKCSSPAPWKDPATVGLMAERVYTMWGMRFCKTRQGYFAGLHRDVRLGDSIWIIQGTRLPTVLRPSTSHPGCFESLGGGYVHGVMNEQVMQQPSFKWKGLSLR